MNGQEKENEIHGDGNAMSAEYWMYDARLGRRWNTDPIVKPWESSYATFSNNPIYFADPHGLDATTPDGGKRDEGNTGGSGAESSPKENPNDGCEPDPKPVTPPITPGGGNSSQNTTPDVEVVIQNKKDAPDYNLLFIHDVGFHSDHAQGGNKWNNDGMKEGNTNWQIAISDNIEAISKLVKKYDDVTCGKPDNIVLMSHGTTGGDMIRFTDGNGPVHLGGQTIKQFIDEGTTGDKIVDDYLKSLVTLASEIKSGGKFVILACNAGANSMDEESLPQQMARLFQKTNNTFDLIFHNDATLYTDNNKGNGLSLPFGTGLTAPEDQQRGWTVIRVSPHGNRTLVVPSTDVQLNKTGTPIYYVPTNVKK